MNSCDSPTLHEIFFKKCTKRKDYETEANKIITKMYAHVPSLYHVNRQNEFNTVLKEKKSVIMAYCFNGHC